MFWGAEIVTAIIFLFYYLILSSPSKNFKRGKPNFGKININSTTVNDYPIYLRTKKFKIGYCPQNGGYFSEMTLSENLRAVAEIIIPKKNLIKNIDSKKFKKSTLGGCIFVKKKEQLSVKIEKT